MSNNELVFAFDKPVTGNTGNNGGGGLEFPKPFKAYKAEVIEMKRETIKYIDKKTGEEKEFTPIKLMLKGIDFKSDEFTCLETSLENKMCMDFIQNWYDAIVASNESMKGAIGNEVADFSKLANKGLQIGIKFEPGYRDPKFAKPSSFAMNIDDVDEYYFNEEKYDAWRDQYWPKEGGNTAPVASTPAQAPAVNGQLPIEDELPF